MCVHRRSLKGSKLEKPIHEIAVKQCGFYLPDKARYDYLKNLPEQEDIAQAIKKAMDEIAKYKTDLQGALPSDKYSRLVARPVAGNETVKQIDSSTSSVCSRTLPTFCRMPWGNMFGQIYQYFLAKFALAEGQGGREFFTPDSVVRLMVEIIEPTQGKLLDPACGSGGKTPL